MTRSQMSALVCFALALSLGSPLFAAGPFEALMQKVPEGANVLVLVNVEQALQSEFARSHDSKQKLADAFSERSILIPPDATQLIMAGQFDLERSTQIWEAAVMNLTTPLNFARLASVTHRSVEKLSGLEAIGSSKAFILNLGDKQLGLLAPSSRQHAARWAQGLKKGNQPLSSYLSKAGSYGDTAGTDVILAIDLTDALPQKFLADRLRKNEVLEGRKVDIDKLASIFAAIKGVRLGIKIGAKCSGTLVVDLQDDPAFMKEFAKPLLLSALGHSGVLLEEMSDWQLALGKEFISLKGVLTDESMRRVMGIVELPADSVAMIESTGVAQSAPPEKTGPKSSEGQVIQASRKYFKTIQQQIKSLRLQKNDAKTLGQVALWINNAARRIDNLPTLHVDNDLADYGATTASELRQMVAALQGVGIQSGARQAQVYASDSSYYGDDDVQNARRSVRAEEKALGAMSALEISRLISDKNAAMRRKMTEKYQVEF